MGGHSCADGDQDREAVDAGCGCGGGDRVHECGADEGEDGRDDKERYVVTHDGHDYALDHDGADVDYYEGEEADGGLDPGIASYELEE